MATKPKNSTANTLYTIAGAVVVFIMFFGERFTVLSIAVSIPILGLLYLADWIQNRELSKVYPGKRKE